MPDRSRTAALILAGGRGTRLAPLAQPFMKPLHPVNGSALIGYALKFAREFEASDVVVVASPANYDRVRGELGADDRIAVQAEPTGVVDAIRVGMKLVPKLSVDHVMILCSDNTFAPGGRWFRTRCEGWNRHLIGIRVDADPDARFSTIVDVWLLPKGSYRGDLVPRWVGPIVVDRARLDERLMSPGTLEDVLNDAGAPFVMVPMECEDHGVAR